MALSSKRTRLTEEALEKVHKLIDSHGGIVKKEEFADIDVDYRRILDFVESLESVWPVCRSSFYLIRHILCVFFHLSGNRPVPLPPMLSEIPGSFHHFAQALFL